MPGALIVVLGLGSLAVTHGSMRAAVITTLVMAVIALSQVVVTGFTGQISFAQLTLAGVGAFSLTRIQHSCTTRSRSRCCSRRSSPCHRANRRAARAAHPGAPVAVTTLALRRRCRICGPITPTSTAASAGAPVWPTEGLRARPRRGRRAVGYPQLGFGIPCLIVLLLAAGGVARSWRSTYGKPNFAIVAVFDEGVGAALVLDGRLYRGAGGAAGEIGHVAVEFPPPLSEDRPSGFAALCRCGRFGHVEAVATPARLREELGVHDISLMA